MNVHIKLTRCLVKVEAQHWSDGLFGVKLLGYLSLFNEARGGVIIEEWSIGIKDWQHEDQGEVWSSWLINGSNRISSGQYQKVIIRHLCKLANSNIVQHSWMEVTSHLYCSIGA